MSRLASYLKQPFCRNRNPWVIIGIPVIVVIFVLAIFEPFFFRLSSFGQFKVLLGFAGVTVLSCFIVQFIFPWFFRQFYSEKSWTLGKEWLHYLFLLLISSVFATFYDIGILQKWNLYNWMWNIAVDMEACISIGLIPVVIIFLISKNGMQKQDLAEVERLNRILQQRIGEIPLKSRKLTLLGTTKEAITVEPENLIFLEASGNYVDVFYFDSAGIVRHKLLRSTIKLMEDILGSYDFLCRTHRAFIVNVRQVVSVNSHTSGYRLLFAGTSHVAYVSRNYVKIFKEKMA